MNTQISLGAALADAAIGEPALMSVAAVARFADVDRRTVHRWIAEGRLQVARTHHAIGRGRTLVLKSSLLALLAGKA